MEEGVDGGVDVSSQVVDSLLSAKLYRNRNTTLRNASCCCCNVYAATVVRLTGLNPSIHAILHSLPVRDSKSR